MNISINEVFKSIQGEGKTIGQPRLFIRLSGCNQSCSFCDTKYHKAINFNNDSFVAEMLKNNPKWVITGGEPLLQQAAILKLIEVYQPEWVEIETNGSIVPGKELAKVVNLWNISPKSPEDQEDELIQLRMANMYKAGLPILKNKLLLNDFIFKFVYSSTKSREFIEGIKKKHFIRSSYIFIMTEGKTKKKQELNQLKVVDYCIRNNFNFSPRLHVLLWDKKIGV